MNIPKIYAEILERNKYLKGIVYSTMERFSDVLTDSTLYFFSEYTDHGIRHIEAVLETTVDIIPKVSVEQFLDNENVAALILSVLLHDIAMHHTFKSFSYLIEQDKVLIPELDQLSWKELWSNYTEEAKKFSSQQKEEIFGDYDHLLIIPKFDDIDKLDGYARKLVGEFLRRHHPRIAHEIALQGLKTQDGIITFGENYDVEKLDIVGLIARSHGMNIRGTYDYLQSKFFKISRDPLGIHVFYLMTILRIADYFQIDINRLIPVSLKLKTFKSPISEIEHEKHFSIKEIRAGDDDPETLYIRALPKSNLVYWKLINLIKDIQSELDQSWAVIGEKYGKEVQRPLLKYRRIVSNLKEKSFLSTVAFIPEQILFKTDDDLAKLLVEPLYGDHPTYGVRELLQNSIDAIHERIFLEKPFNKYEGKIEVNLLHNSDEKYFFEIIDDGKGMNAKEIKNYFLKAGATNRKSKEWDDLYLDTENKSKVLKSGKFGVGILAAFLIGEEIEVKTRRYDEQQGLYFKFNINSKNVEITKVQYCPIGTTIKIQLQNEVLTYFKNPATGNVSWDEWYTLKKPKVTYNSLVNYNEKYGNSDYDPGYFDKDENWIEFESKGYSKIRWSYHNKKNVDAYKLTCNGIVIPQPPKIQSGSLPSPNIQIFDFNGLLPINLNRNSLGVDYLPFEKDLLKSIFKQILKEILDLPPTIYFNTQIIRISKYSEIPKLFGGLKVQDFFNGFVYTLSGYYIKNSYINDILRGFKVILLKVYSNGELENIDLKIDSEYVLEIEKVNSSTTFDVVKYQLKKNIEYDRLEWAIFQKIDDAQALVTSNKSYKLSSIEVIGKQYLLLKRNDVKKVPIHFGSLKEQEIKSIQILMCLSSVRYTFTQMNSSFDSYIREVFDKLNNSLIPYDEKLRSDKIELIMQNA